jgi:hypothetical protein
MKNKPGLAYLAGKASEKRKTLDGLTTQDGNLAPAI